MFSQLKKNLMATKIFFFVRFAASAVVGLVYLIIAAGVQYLYVSWFGESTFNYIVGGCLSLYLGALACTYLGKLLFMFVRGWHMAALAYAKQIRKKHLPALDAGMSVFQKHFSSFAVVYGASMLIGRFVNKGAEELWKLLEAVPYLCSLEKFSKNPIVSKMAKDILDTAFDGVIYYIVKYTKPGLSDDVSVLPEAMRRYLYALPQVMLSSLGSYFLFYVIPKIVKWILIVYLIFMNGLVAGILLNVLFYPLFYVVQHSIFEPLQTIIMISCYSKHCQEEALDDSPYKTIVDKIIESLGLNGVLTDEEEGQEETEEAAPDEKVKAEPKPQAVAAGPDAVIDVAPVFEEEVPVPSTPPRGLNELLKAAAAATAGNEEELRVEDLPLADEVEEPAATPRANLNSLLFRPSHEEGVPAVPDVDDDDEEEEFTPPVTRLSALLGNISPSALQQTMGDALNSVTGSDTQVSDGDDVNPLGGGHIDLL